MSRLLTRRLRPSKTFQILTAAGLAALVLVALPPARCEAAQAAWPALAGLAQAQPSTVPGGIVMRTAHALPASRTAPRRTDKNAAKIILAIVLAAVAAFDLWILRHLQKVYLPARWARRKLCSLRARKRPKQPYMD